MKGSLYLDDRKIDFYLPSQIYGSFSFGEEDEDTKLINIEARESKWVLYSTKEVKVIYNGKEVEEVALKDNEFYYLKRDEKKYLVGISKRFDNTFNPYSFKDKLLLIIGNNNKCNIKYNKSLFNSFFVEIRKENEKIILETIGEYAIYINNLAFKGTCLLKEGDFIDCYGLKIYLLKNLLFINKPNENVTIDINDIGLTIEHFPVDENYNREEIVDVDLYNKNNYFYKSPRLRRIIETKTIKIDAPPKQGENKDLPLILTIAPMFTMGLMSVVMLINTINKIKLGKATLEESWPSLATSGIMLASMLLWPLITRLYTKINTKRQKKELIKKYTKYLNEKRRELESEAKLQREIIIENLISLKDCLNMISHKNLSFWDKRINQNDFLVVRIGVGDEPLAVDVKYPEEGFSIEENDLKTKAEETVAEYKYIKNVPIGYSFYENKLTAIMGDKKLKKNFVDNVLLQLLTFYSYDDLKIVTFTNEKNKQHWEYLRYLNHSLNNEKNIRFFATDQDSTKNVSEFLSHEVSIRLEQCENNKVPLFKPYYLILIDDYEKVRKQEFMKKLTELNINIGFSIIILENRLDNLPSECDNFIMLDDGESGVLKNSYEKQEQIKFYNEISQNINMMSIAKILANVPVEIISEETKLPESYTFLEMEKVGKVEQLNILNRWNNNDPTLSLKAELGISSNGDLVYLDLHEKYHGPHGLIAGMTGSGKSEFIISYILSMAINYSPDFVSFILIDYKGGGLAYAFENKATGVSLPHLAGTITNLDKTEMDRTLVSIDSEVKRRQIIFNEARDNLGETTMDIYKYQQFYKEGRLTEPIPHLFIVCDEFAELKAQQPDFMDNLISIARIGRSLGVHLILATQKPSGVVNDQIWSNTKFRVCLKVQSEADSKEMLKKGDAAYLKQAGRFYLQVGYDEIFILGQSAWCGAKYYPQDKIYKTVDKSVNFLDDSGRFIKNIQESPKSNTISAGDQISAIMKTIIEVSGSVNKRAKRLWLEDIPPIILVDNLKQKYGILKVPFQIKAVLGEYDAPEIQEQGLLEMNLLKDGNTIIYGTDSEEKEMLLKAILYSTLMMYKTEELNYYIVDYGSETLGMFKTFNQVGGVLLPGEDERLKNLLKLIKNTLDERKKILASFGGDFASYNSQKEDKMPLQVIIINNYDGLIENNNTLIDELGTLTRDSERYGILYIITGGTITSITRKVNQNFPNVIAMHLKDTNDYYSMFANQRTKMVPRNIVGRGLVNNGKVHEFQTASIINESDNINSFIATKAQEFNAYNTTVAKQIPTLPDKVTFDVVQNMITNLKDTIIGISKSDIEPLKYDFYTNKITHISSMKLSNINSFIISLMKVFRYMNGVFTIFIDSGKLLPKLFGRVNNYYKEDFDQVFDILNTFIGNQIKNPGPNQKLVFVLYGIDKIKSEIVDKTKLEKFINGIKDSSNCYLLICDSEKNIKACEYETWFTKAKNNQDGIWIGRGINEQTLIKISNYQKGNTDINNSFGVSIKDTTPKVFKLINFEDEIEVVDKHE